MPSSVEIGFSRTALKLEAFEKGRIVIRLSENEGL
jgi:hypothetical protein